MLTLNDLKPRTVDINIVFAEGREVIVPLKVPSWVEWQELGMEVPHPEPEMVAIFKNGKKAYEKESGPAYQAKVDIANNQRTLRRLTFSIIGGGNFPELKDSSVEEQMKAVSSMDAGALHALTRTLNSMVTMTIGRIRDNARFREGTLSKAGDADMLTESLDDGEMEVVKHNGKRATDSVATLQAE